MDYTTNQEMRDASPSIFEAQKKPSTKAIENLKEWRDSEAKDKWTKEGLDAVIAMLEDEVL